MIQAGYDIIKLFEGLVDGDPSTPGLDPYLCPANVPTIGWGSTWGFDGRAITMDHPPISQQEAQELLEREVSHTKAVIARLITEPLTEEQHAALVSFTYNVGSGNLQSSTLRMKLNRGDVQGAADEFPKWRKAGGKVLAGLVRRRAVERDLFLKS